MLGSVDEVVIECREPRRLAQFWAAVLGGEVGERDADWCYIFPPGWSQLSFQRVPEAKTLKNRLHIDVAVEDLAAATDRAARIGARRIGEVQHTVSGSFQVLEDPEGNEWCLVVPSSLAPTAPRVVDRPQLVHEWRVGRPTAVLLNLGDVTVRARRVCAAR